MSKMFAKWKMIEESKSKLETFSEDSMLEKHKISEKTALNRKINKVKDQDVKLYNKPKEASLLTNICRNSLEAEIDFRSKIQEPKSDCSNIGLSFLTKACRENQTEDDIVVELKEDEFEEPRKKIAVERVEGGWIQKYFVTKAVTASEFDQLRNTEAPESQKVNQNQLEADFEKLLRDELKKRLEDLISKDSESLIKDSRRLTNSLHLTLLSAEERKKFSDGFFQDNSADCLEIFKNFFFKFNNTTQQLIEVKIVSFSDQDNFFLMVFSMDYSCPKADLFLIEPLSSYGPCFPKANHLVNTLRNMFSCLDWSLNVYYYYKKALDDKKINQCLLIESLCTVLESPLLDYELLRTKLLKTLSRRRFDCAFKRESHQKKYSQHENCSPSNYLNFFSSEEEQTISEEFNEKESFVDALQQLETPLMKLSDDKTNSLNLQPVFENYRETKDNPTNQAQVTFPQVWSLPPISDLSLGILIGDFERGRRDKSMHDIQKNKRDLLNDYSITAVESIYGAHLIQSLLADNLVAAYQFFNKVSAKHTQDQAMRQLELRILQLNIPCYSHGLFILIVLIIDTQERRIRMFVLDFFTSTTSEYNKYIEIKDTLTSKMEMMLRGVNFSMFTSHFTQKKLKNYDGNVQELQRFLPLFFLKLGAETNEETLMEKIEKILENDFCLLRFKDSKSMAVCSDC